MNLIKTNPDLRQDLLKQGAKAMGAIMVAVVAGLFSASFISDQAERLADHRREIGTIAAGFEALEQAERQLAESEDVFSAIDEALIPIAEIETFITAAEATATQSGLEQQDLVFGNLTRDHSGETTTAVVPVTITLRGDVDSLADYIQQFEDMPYFAEITSFSLNAPGSGWESSDSNILLNGRLHILSR